MKSYHTPRRERKTGLEVDCGLIDACVKECEGTKARKCRETRARFFVHEKKVRVCYIKAYFTMQLVINSTCFPLGVELLNLLSIQYLNITFLLSFIEKKF